MSNMIDLICIHLNQNLKSEFINKCPYLPTVSGRFLQMGIRLLRGAWVPCVWCSCFKTLTPDPHRRSPLTCNEEGSCCGSSWCQTLTSLTILPQSLGRGHWYGCHNESNHSSVIGRVLWLPSDSNFEHWKLGPGEWQLMNICWTCEVVAFNEV